MKKILITNDDGIFSEGIRHLALWTQTYADVTVVAPTTQRSGVSHGIEIHKPFEVKKIDLLPGIESYAVDSTPADCVRFATAGLGKEFDLVLSGINRGLNVGTDILYSATCGAIFEAGSLGIPGVAVSTVPETFATAVASLDRIYDYFRERKLLELHSLYNVNIPETVKEIRIVRQGGPYYRDRFTSMKNDLYMAKGYSVYDGGANLDEDLDAVMNGYLTVTPFTIDRTDMTVLQKLKGTEEEK